jgi:hypothetical protein
MRTHHTNVKSSGQKKRTRYLPLKSFSSTCGVIKCARIRHIHRRHEGYTHTAAMEGQAMRVMQSKHGNVHMHRIDGQWICMKKDSDRRQGGDLAPLPSLPVTTMLSRVTYMLLELPTEVTLLLMHLRLDVALCRCRRTSCIHIKQCTNLAASYVFISGRLWRFAGHAAQQILCAQYTTRRSPSYTSPEAQQQSCT